MTTLSIDQEVFGKTIVSKFNAGLRDELLNGEVFYSLEDVRRVTGWSGDHYNRLRPHSSLGNQPPAPETITMPNRISYS